MGRVKIYLSKDGSIWKGYVISDDNLHYARLSGHTSGFEAGVVQPIWILERSDPDKENWLRIGYED